MADYEQISAREALRLHYARSCLPVDGGRAASEWTLELGPLMFGLTNFEWRRRALPYHDLHHLLTGYPCTPAGEIKIAAWEFAAGRYPNVLSTLFCLPLVGLGAVVMPARSFGAFVRGRRSSTLYARSSAEDPLALSVRELRDRLLPGTTPRATIGDVARYLGLVGMSLLLSAIPLVVLLLLFLNR